MPVFADEILDSFTEEQRALCGNDIACLYDLVQTGDEEVAQQTLDTSNDLEQLASTIGK